VWFSGPHLDPPLFIFNSLDLHPVTPSNMMVKYVDDATLIFPASNRSTIPDELARIAAWSYFNNQSPNIMKSSELIVARRWTRGYHGPPLLPGIPRVDNLLLLGVVLDSHFTFSPPPPCDKGRRPGHPVCLRPQILILKS